MPEWITDFFNVDWSWGSFAWNGLIGVVYDILTKTPQEFSPTAWHVITTELYPWFLSAGIALLNLFFFIGFVRQNINLRDNITIETWIEGFIKVIIANGIMSNGLSLVSDLVSLSVSMTSFAIGSEAPVLSVTEVDAGSVAFFLILGWNIYLILCLVCGIMVLLEVIKRYLYLNVAIVVGPIALSTLAGGRGLESTAHSWIKAFLTYCFQIVIIAIILRIGTLMGSSLAGFLQSSSGIGDWFDGFTLFLNNMIFIVFMTVAVKGSDNMLKQMFDLR